MTYSKYTTKQTHNLFEHYAINHLKKKETVNSYLSELNSLMTYFKTDASQITRQQAIIYQTYLENLYQSKNITYETYIKKIKLLRSMYQYFYNNKFEPYTKCTTSPFMDIYIKEADIKYVEDEILSYEEVNDFFEYVRSKSTKDYFILHILYFSLLKPSELLALDIEDLSYKNGIFQLSYHHKSTYKSRIIKLPTILNDLFEKYKAESYTGPLIKNQRGGRLSLRSFQIILKRYSDEYNHSIKVFTSTSIYHAGIYHALKAGMPKDKLVNQLGISDTKFLDRYIVISNDLNNVSSSCDYIKVVTNRQE